MLTNVEPPTAPSMPVHALLAEDHRALSRALKRALEDNDFRVDSALDGHDADAKARMSPYDVIILNARLPLIDGATLVRNWRATGLKSRILALTAEDRSADQADMLNHGADVCLAKPFQFDELLTRLRALVRDERPASTSIVRVHDLEMDLKERTTKRAGRMIHLTPREFELLQFLAQHRGQVVTRPMIWNHFYQDKDNTASNIVDVYIRYLRTKIDRGFDKPLVLTAWGEGYKLRGDDE
jgi:DNA-binding response OmpR family regulator